MTNTTPLALAICLMIAAAPAAPALAQTQIQTRAEKLAELDEQLPGKLINDPTRIDWPMTGKATRRPLRSPDIPGGGAALQITVATKGDKPHDVLIKIPLTASVEKDSDVTIAFYARALNGTPGEVQVRFQQDVDPYPGFGEKVIAVGPEWKLYEATGKASVALNKKAGIVGLQLAGRAQTVEIGQAMVVSGATTLFKTAAAPTPVAASGPPELPAKLVAFGTILMDSSQRNWPVYGPGLTAEPFAAPAPVGAATRFVMAEKAANPWDAGINIPIPAAISSGDSMRLAFMVRAPAAATPDQKGVITVRVQGNAAPYAGFGNNSIAITPNWQLVQVPILADRAMPAGTGTVALQFGGAAQTVELGPVWLLKKAATPAAP